MSVSASVSTLRITYFQAEKLYQVSGGRSLAQRQSSPYRITTFRGPEVGLIGSLPAVLNKLHEVNNAAAANQAEMPEAENSLLQKFKRYCLQH
ncbi:MAG TPA: hypothetical protein VJN01_12665 [Xanthomonadales bacterium]|nr:hypothetical protein [Xanthomonadales bacterium]